MIPAERIALAPTPLTVVRIETDLVLIGPRGEHVARMWDAKAAQNARLYPLIPMLEAALVDVAAARTKIARDDPGAPVAIGNALRKVDNVLAELKRARA